MPAHAADVPQFEEMISPLSRIVVRLG